MGGVSAVLNFEFSSIYYHGYMPEEIDDLLKQGLTPNEIEEFLYCY